MWSTGPSAAATSRLQNSMNTCAFTPPSRIMNRSVPVAVSAESILSRCRAPVVRTIGVLPRGARCGIVCDAR
jgi:hypothetical protein